MDEDVWMNMTWMDEDVWMKMYDEHVLDELVG